MIVKTM